MSTTPYRAAPTFVFRCGRGHERPGDAASLASVEAGHVFCLQGECAVFAMIHFGPEGEARRVRVREA